ncbi:MAG: hypothetical protein M1822_004500 [Bathelium mastoideum]|nr:MAG: hypothetical protein M1822_004500 [Bathelium mastoideum]
MERKQSLWNSKPRRRQTNKPIPIFEDEDTTQCNNLRHACFPLVPSATRKKAGECRSKPTDYIFQEALRRKLPRNSLFVQNASHTMQEQAEIQKPPRRRTIYIPSEETSILTIHPGAPSRKLAGAVSPTQNTLLFPRPENTEEQPRSPTQPVLNRRESSRMSLAGAPRRAPLQSARGSLQPKAGITDIAGKQTGKENIPPDHSKFFGDVVKIPDEKDGLTSTATVGMKNGNRMSIAARPRRMSTAPQALNSEGSRKRTNCGTKVETLKTSKNKNNVSGEAHRTCATGVRPDEHGEGTKNKMMSHPQRSEGLPPGHGRDLKLSMKGSISNSSGHSTHHAKNPYPVLSEELERPELYEDHWLHHQEIAISQLINGIFESHHQELSPRLHDEGKLRRRLLELYSHPSIALLHKRLQASLLYGALTTSKDAMSRAARVKDDVGMKRKFLNLWLDSYDTRALKAAAEVVIGREAPPLSGSKSSPAKRTNRKVVEDFLEIFLLRNCDAPRPEREVSLGEDDCGSLTWSWRRMVVRSLLLIMLLDRAKCSGAISGCLFRVTSGHKSSEAVLKTVASLVLPSLGDVIRPLDHLDFRLQHIQYPLQEFTYRITNLAVDLRDGVILTHLVELLLSPSGDLPTQNDGTVTLTLPSGEILTSTNLFDYGSGQSWALSQHLKYPCIGRAQKLHNAQIAISALDAVPGIPEQVLQDIKAEDIVDGHREKTLRLLWVLVGRWGLGSLVNWDELRKEIYHLRQKCQDAHPVTDEESFSDNEIDSSETNTSQIHQATLKAWAASIGHLHGVPVRNLSTSFSDGRVFAAIVDEYWPFFPKSNSSTSQTKPKTLTVHAKLKLLGCSTAFTDLIPTTTTSTSSSFSSQPTRILTPPTTIPTLAFLASRLVPLARTHRAACAIQRLYRLRLARRTISTRLALARLAHHCAEVVNTRQRVERAAVVLQRAWRGVLVARIARLEADVVGVQAVVRGWMVRRGIGRVGKKGRGGGRRMERRVVGVGW